MVPQHLVLGRRGAQAGAGRAGGSAITAGHPFLGSLELLAGAGPDGTGPVPLFCENETNLARLYGAAPATAVSQGRDRR